MIFRGEERPARIVTRRWVESNWSEAEKVLFRQYAYPLSEEVYAMWDDDPNTWAPQNHSCEANTGYVGLNVVALREIRPGEELTLDYSALINEEGEPFDCRCGASSCRGRVVGSPGNSVTEREQETVR